jgi:hypothetical protein
LIGKLTRRCPFVFSARLRACFIDDSEPAYSGPQRRPRTGRRRFSVLIVVAVIGVISVAAMIAPVIGHRVSNCRAPDPTDDRADRTADNSPGDGAPDTSSDRAAFVGKGNLR